MEQNTPSRFRLPCVCPRGPGGGDVRAHEPDERSLRRLLPRPRRYAGYMAVLSTYAQCFARRLDGGKLAMDLYALESHRKKTKPAA